MTVPRPTPSSIERPSRQFGPWLLLGGLLALAVALRFWRLGAWNFEATEMFTLRDSVRPQWGNPRPLGYLLTYYLVHPFRPLDEFGLRLLPAVFGVLAVPAMYAVTRPLAGTRAALFAGLLVAVSPLQVFYSQFARYWSLVFLLSAIFPFALYLAARDRSTRAAVLGLVAMILAVLAHPVAALLLGGPALWLAWTYARPERLKAAWRHQGVRWAIIAAVVVVAAITVKLLPVLHAWISMHDRNPGMGQFLLPTKRANGPKQALLLLAFLEGLTLPVALAAAAGVYLLWRNWDRTLAAYLLWLALFPLAFIALISTRTPVSTFYLLPAAPVFYLSAGVFLDHLFRIDWVVRPQWLMPAVVMLSMLTAGAPTLISQYRNGRRFEFRSVARWLQPQLSPADVVYSDQHMVLGYYLKGRRVEKLRQTEALKQARSELGDAGTLWVVAPAPAHAFRTNLKAGGLADWMYRNCQLRTTIGTGRLDFRQQYLQVDRCPPARPDPSAGAAG
jgi:uncharacterized membrane protein